jgi:hypothetical protein
MSYEDTHCPCGDRKPTDTMLCDVCLADLAARREMMIFKDGTQDMESRRHAASILLTLSRSRKRRNQETRAA